MRRDYQPGQDKREWPDDAVTQTLRELSRRVPPATLSSSLRVLASRERNRVLRGSRQALADRAQLFFDNLMRPMALPFAGGIFSAVVLFSMWVIPTYPLRGSSTADVPTTLYTQAAVKQTLVPPAASGDVIVDVTVEPLPDGTGRMVDYQILYGNVANNEALRRSIETFLIFTVFQPATALGQPVLGKIRLSLQSSQIDVKG
jgi:hypothetical protein